MSLLSATALAPQSAAPPPLVTGATAMVVGVVAGLPASVYGVPYVIESVQSAAATFGLGRLTRAIGELTRQRCPSILAYALSTEDDLPGFYDAIIDQPFDLLVPAGLLATSSRIQSFAGFAYMREQRGYPITIVMPADPTPGVGVLTSAPVSAAAGITLGVDANLNYARYFVLTLDTLTINPNLPSQYQADAAPSVAGLIARTAIPNAIAYTRLLGCELVNGYTDTDCRALASAGYVVCTTTARHGVVPFLGVTATSDNPASPNYSPAFHKHQTLRTANYVVRVLQDKFGQVVGDAAPSTLSKDVDAALRTLQSAGIFLAYNYTLTLNAVAGTVSVNIAILPPYETTMIAVQSQVRFVN